MASQALAISVGEPCGCCLAPPADRLRGVGKFARRRHISIATDLEHDPEKHALGLDPRVGTGFPSRQTRSV
jgi:hypothetical protein